MQKYTTDELIKQNGFLNAKLCDIYNRDNIPRFIVKKVRTCEEQDILVNYGVFSGGEVYVQINDIEKYELKDSYVYVRVYIIHPHDILYLIQLEDILLKAGAKIYLEIPYFPYARQDRYCADGQSFSLKLFVNMLSLNNATYDQRRSITMWDIHSNVSIDLLKETDYGKTIVNLPPSYFIKKCPELYNKLLTNDNNIVLICPDKGAISRTKQLQEFINKDRKTPIEIIHCDKHRDPVTGKIIGMKIQDTDINLTGKECLIADDICDGGATFIDLSSKLKDAGLSKVYLYVTHGIFSKGLIDLQKNIDWIYTTNSRIYTNYIKHVDNVTVIVNEDTDLLK